MLARLALAVFLGLALPVQAQEAFRFSSGAPAEDQKPIVIIPLLTEAFRRLGLEFEAVHRPSRRSVVSSNSGETDGGLHRVHNFHEITQNQYPNLIRINVELMRTNIAFFARKGSGIASMKDLEGKTIAYRGGRRFLERVVGDIPGAKAVAVNAEMQVFELLAKGRVDVVGTETAMGAFLIAQNPALMEIEEVLHIHQTRIYSYINKKHAHLVTPLEAALMSMKKDGTFDAISRAAQQTALARMAGS